MFTTRKPLPGTSDGHGLHTRKYDSGLEHAIRHDLRWLDMTATETHTVPAIIPRHYHVTFLNCNTNSCLAVALLLRPL